MIDGIVFTICVIAGYFGFQYLWGYIGDIMHRGKKL